MFLNDTRSINPDHPFCVSGYETRNLARFSRGERNGFVFNMARCCSQAGASLRDVQRIAGHADLGTTERYVEPSLDAQKRLIALA